MKRMWDYRMNVFPMSYLDNGKHKVADGLVEHLRKIGPSFAEEEVDLDEYPSRFNPQRMKIHGPYYKDSFLFNIDYEASNARTIPIHKIFSEDTCIDTIAWYSSFRLYENWGIYIRRNKIFNAANKIFDGLKIGGKNASIEEKIERYLRLVIKHEQFHFLTDIMVGQLELFQIQPMYLNQKSPILVEERMANAYALKSIQSKYPKKGGYDNTIDVAKDSIRSEGLPGYMEGPDYMTAKLYRLGLAELSNFYLAKSKNYPINSLGGINWTGFYPSLKSVFDKIPIYLIDEKVLNSGPYINFIQKAESITRSKKFIKSLQKLNNPGIQSTLDKVLGYCKKDLRTKSLDFKPWGNKSDKHFSIRVNKNIRLHMRNINGAHFELLEIGSHKKMGHG